MTTTGVLVCIAWNLLGLGIGYGIGLTRALDTNTDRLTEPRKD